tara:strand:+ start:641 stop:1360 length:720 start_codon:yes stop_codon:yes gene_type:complete
MSGNSTEEKVDYLQVDKPIPGQSFVCLSFVSPENTLKNKDVFFLHNFLKSLSKKYDLDENKLTEEYDNYVYSNKDNLEKLFHEKNNFQTTVRGVKVRGTYDSYREAEVRAKVLQRIDKSHHVFVGQVGYWLPWDPNADQVENQEYLESELNSLVKNYKENQDKKDIFYQEEVEKKVQSANEESKKQKEKNSENDGGEGEGEGETEVQGQNDSQELLDKLSNETGHSDMKKEFEEYKKKE